MFVYDYLLDTFIQSLHQHRETVPNSDFRVFTDATRRAEVVIMLKSLVYVYIRVASIFHNILALPREQTRLCDEATAHFSLKDILIFMYFPSIYKIYAKIKSRNLFHG